jgi:hypothetical protein
VCHSEKGCESEIDKILTNSGTKSALRINHPAEEAEEADCVIIEKLTFISITPRAERELRLPMVAA